MQRSERATREKVVATLDRILDSTFDPVLVLKLEQAITAMPRAASLDRSRVGKQLWDAPDDQFRRWLQTDATDEDRMVVIVALNELRQGARDAPLETVTLWCAELGANSLPEAVAFGFEWGPSGK